MIYKFIFTTLIVRTDRQMIDRFMIYTIKYRSRLIEFRLVCPCSRLSCNKHKFEDSKQAVNTVIQQDHRVQKKEMSEFVRFNVSENKFRRLKKKNKWSKSQGRNGNITKTKKYRTSTIRAMSDDNKCFFVLQFFCGRIIIGI